MAMKTRPQAAKETQTTTTLTTPYTQWLKTSDMAKRLSRHPGTLTRMVDRGVLPPPARVGRALLWDVSATEAALQASKGAK